MANPAKADGDCKSSSDFASLIELEPVTGRTHQLRVHMQSIGHPMLGDSLYAPEVRTMTPRLMSHCQKYQFGPPFTEEPLSFDVPQTWSASPPYLHAI
jgi:tRNA pseudouridine32 synthase/23S rRNA pseudouridine746 synthase